MNMLLLQLLLVLVLALALVTLPSSGASSSISVLEREEREIVAAQKRASTFKASSDPNSGRLHHGETPSGVASANMKAMTPPEASPVPQIKELPTFSASKPTLAELQESFARFEAKVGARDSRRAGPAAAPAATSVGDANPFSPRKAAGDAWIGRGTGMLKRNEGQASRASLAGRGQAAAAAAEAATGAEEGGRRTEGPYSYPVHAPQDMYTQDQLVKAVKVRGEIGWSIESE